MSKITDIWNSPKTEQLSSVLTAISNKPEMESFLRDVLTEKEILEISARLQAAIMLSEGIKYSQVVSETKLSSRTVARISNWLKNGKGGYQRAIDIVHHRHTSPAAAD